MKEFKVKLIHAKKYTYFIILWFNPVFLFAQSEIDSLRNRPDGFHIENHHGYKFEFYTRAGKVNGVYKIYDAKKSDEELMYIVNIKNDTLYGKAYWFYDGGQVSMIEDISLNKNVVLKNYKDSIEKPFYKSYTISYNRNGIKISEGIILYNNDLGIGSISFGKWIYYDDTGNYLRTQDCSKGCW